MQINIGHENQSFQLKTAVSVLSSIIQSKTFKLTPKEREALINFISDLQTALDEKDEREWLAYNLGILL
jgi:hypothetical protein